MTWRGSTLYLQGEGETRARGFKNAKVLVAEKRAGDPIPRAYEFNFDGGRVRAEIRMPAPAKKDPTP